MTKAPLTLALIQDVFPNPADHPRLHEHLAEAKAAGADLAILPELPLDPWYPAERTSKPEHAEGKEGPRHRALAEAARQEGIGVLGGVLFQEEEGRRFNRALLFDASGALLGHYDKAHLPAEEGFWEGDHYEASSIPPRPIEFGRWPLGLQICSDANRPIGAYLLAAAGAACVINPRATEAATFHRWRKVLQANALVSGLYVVSVNRSRSELGVNFGGPAVVYAPDGEVVTESEETVTLVDLDPAQIEKARQGYPGYLKWNRKLYTDGWASDDNGA